MGIAKRDSIRPGKVPLKSWLRGTALIVVAPTMILLIFTFYQRLMLWEAGLAVFLTFIVALIFVHPYLANLSALTEYVNKLANNEKAAPPDLSFLNNVEELSQSVAQLQHTWEERRRQLEGYLGESKILIDSLPNILIMLDNKGGVVQMNNTAHSLFRGKEMQELLHDILHKSDIAKEIKNVIDTGEGHTMEFEMPPPIDRDFVVRIQRFPVFSPRGISLFIVMHDITELKQTEQTFADFVANASHEIRTPLTSIVGFIETIRTSAKDDPEAQQHFLNLMAEQADRMSKLVADLLSLSKIERNISSPPTDKVKIHEVVEESVQQVRWLGDEKSITLEVEAPKRIPHIIGDYDQLIQVTYNLISNAIKYGKKDSKITIAVSVQPNIMSEEHVFLGVDKLLSVAVTDQGDGIPPEHLPRLTERFYRVDKARSRKVGGTGLGLSIVKHILERHRGLLTIESTVGKGSTFTYWLPISGK